MADVIFWWTGAMAWSAAGIGLLCMVILGLGHGFYFASYKSREYFLAARLEKEFGADINKLRRAFILVRATHGNSIKRAEFGELTEELLNCIAEMGKMYESKEKR